MTLYAVRIASVNVRPGTDTQTAACARQMERQQSQYVFLGETPREAIDRLRQALTEIRQLQRVTGEWLVEVGGQEIKADMRLTDIFMVGYHSPLHFEAQA